MTVAEKKRRAAIQARKARIEKAKKDAKVNKALSAEEQTLLSNIKSMVSELESLGAGEAAMAEDGLEIEIGNEDEEDEMRPMKSAEGPTARDKADARLEETDEESAKNLTAVKALVRRMDGMIQKSNAPAPNQNLLMAVTGLTQVVKSLADRIEAQETATVHILEGLGVGEQIQKSITPATKKPVQSTDTVAVLKDLLGIKDTNGDLPSNDQSQTVHKSLAKREVLRGLLTQ